MEKNRAIKLLKGKLSEVPRLRDLRYGNQEFKLWHDGVLDIIKAALGKDDQDKFASWRPIHVQGLFSDDVYQKEYLDRIEDYETGLKSIIQKYETLGVDLEDDLIEQSPKVFISHGKGEGALRKLETFLTEVGVKPIVVKDQPNLDRSVEKKVEDCLNEADFVIILATGDDEIANKPNTKQPRQNVIHEIGLAQKTHAGKIIYLLEEGTEFPSNINPKVYESFARQSMDGAFTAIVREMRELGFLKVVTPVKSKE